VSAPPPLIFFPYIMHAHAHAHLFGFSQVVATADAVAQALSTSPRQKKGLIQAHSFASTISEFSLFLLSSLPHFASLKKKQYSFALSYKKWIEVIVIMMTIVSPGACRDWRGHNNAVISHATPTCD